MEYAIFQRGLHGPDFSRIYLEFVSKTWMLKPFKLNNKFRMNKTVDLLWCTYAC